MVRPVAALFTLAAVVAAVPEGRNRRHFSLKPTRRPVPELHGHLSVTGGAAPVSAVDVVPSVVTSLAFEMAELTALVAAADAVAKKVNPVVGKALILATWFLVIFGSSFLMSAMPQALRPTEPLDPAWYATLKKPRWNPPGWLFPIMWLIISKPTQMAAVTVLTLGGRPALAPATLMYLFHLCLGDVWNTVFFVRQQISLGLLVILVFYAALWASSFLFWQESQVAGALLLPTCGWVTVASSLNFAIFLLNKDAKGNGK